MKDKEGNVEEVRLLDVSQLNIYGHVQITTGALTACFDREIPVAFFSHGGWFRGMAHGLPSKHVELQRRQIALAPEAALAVARAAIAGKIRNARTLLRTHLPEAVLPESDGVTAGRLLAILTSMQEVAA